MVRDLTDRERAVLLAMIDRGVDLAAGPVEARRRAGWRDQVATTRVGGECGCGTCPSIGLIAVDGVEPTGPRAVLSGSHHSGGLLLFVDGDRLSRLELFPTREQSVPEFPSPDQLTFPRHERSPDG